MIENVAKSCAASRFALGWPVLVILIAIFVLMTFKPTLW